jgi:general secretion pathway protein A
MMFLTHFNMTQNPFTERPPLEWLLKDERMAQGLARLDYLANDGLLALVLGQTGVGKSSLLRLFLSALSKNRYRAIYVHLTHLNAPGLLRLIVSQLGEEPRLGKDRLFRQIIERVHKADAATILIIDEAHLIDPDALTDLRLLLSSAIDDAPPLKIVLCGQEPLRALITRASHADLQNRISVRCHLHPLQKEQTDAYIDARVRHSGASDKLFEPEAKTSIHEYAAGIPRLINNIATACLIHAATQDANKITEPLVNQAMAEFRLP